MKNDIVTVIVTFNRLDLLKQCINCLKNQTIKTDILLFDNASTDQTGNWVSEQEDIIYIKSNQNLGGAAGFSKGIKEACLLDYKYLWIMDDDCLPNKDSLEKLLEADKILNGNYGWLSSKCLWTDGSICPMNLQRKTPYKDIDINANSDLIESSMASFVSLFLKKETVIKYGLPIKEFFIWTDDWEYTRRVSRKEKCYTVKDSVVVHAMKNKTVVNIAKDSEDRLERYKYFYRNDVFLYKKEGIIGWIWLLAKDIYHSLLVIKSFKFNRIPIIWKGFFKGISFNPKIEKVND